MAHGEPTIGSDANACMHVETSFAEDFAQTAWRRLDEAPASRGTGVMDAHVSRTKEYQATRAATVLVLAHGWTKREHVNMSRSKH
jgi:hypothetical protein